MDYRRLNSWLLDDRLFDVRLLKVGVGTLFLVRVIAYASIAVTLIVDVALDRNVSDRRDRNGWRRV